MTSLINGIIEPVSKKTLIDNSSLIITDVSPERIRLEIMKAMKYKKPSFFFKNLHEINALKYIFPCLELCFELDGGPHHGETVFEHCMMTGDAISPKFPLLRLAAFLHDAGKYNAAIEKEGKLTFAGHEKYTNRIQEDLKKLRFSNKDIDYISSVTNVHMRPLKENTTPKAVRKLLHFLNKYNVDYHDFLRLRIADRKANLIKKPYSLSEIKTRLNKLLSELPPKGNRTFTINNLEISGNQIMDLLNVEEGPKIGMILDYLLEKVIEDPDLNNRASLRKLIAEYNITNVVSCHNKPYK